MRIHKLHLPFQKLMEFQHIYSPAGREDLLLRSSRCQLHAADADCSGGRICTWGKSLRNFFLVLSLLHSSCSGQIPSYKAEQQSRNLLLLGPGSVRVLLQQDPSSLCPHVFLTYGSSPQICTVLVEIAAWKIGHQRAPGSHLYHDLN